MHVFPALTWEQSHFLCFSPFQTWITLFPKLLSKSLQMYWESKKGPLDICAKFH